MALATSNLVALAYIKESAFGTTPVSNTPNAATALRFTGESLAFSLSKTQSNEIRSDRQVTDLVTVSAEASGGINFELSFKEYDEFLAAAVQGTWSYFGAVTPGATQGISTATFTGTFASTTITASVAPTGVDAFTNLAKGQWFKLIAPSHANDGKLFRVSNTVSPTTTVITVDAATPLTTGTSIANCKLSTSRLVNGVTQPSYSIERQATDITQFFTYRGMTLSKMNLKFASGSLTSGSMEFMGKDSVRATVTAMPAAAAASQAFDVQNGVSGMTWILEGGSVLSGTFIKSLELNIDNTLRGRDAIGTLGNVSIGAGTFNVSGTLEVYLADGTLYDKFINSTVTSLQFSTQDGAGNGYVFQIPQVKFGDAKVTAGGKDQDIMLSIPYTGLADFGSQGAVTGKTLIIDRVD